ncbi:MAG: hypothetical protein HC904_05100 [Blastochloris sp.]|nr:hypothetical protein [Blastochloris sp.]
MSTSARLLLHGLADRFLNMAIDESLLREVSQPVLRFYRWSEADALSIGYFDSVSELPAARPFVRRYTGGGLVDHARDFTYSVIVPKQHPLCQQGTSASYQAIHEAVTQALLEQGIGAELAPCCFEATSKACFQKPVKYDVVQGQSKLAGAAQRRTREGCLHQGSILVHPIDVDSLRLSLTKTLGPLLAETLTPDQLTQSEEARAQTLREERYSRDDWNFSR